MMMDHDSKVGNCGTRSVDAQQIAPPEIKEGDMRSTDGKAVRKKNKRCGRGRENNKQLAREIAQARSPRQIMESIIYYEFSDLTLALTLKAIKLNPENELVWDTRRVILEKLDIDLRKELEDIASIPSGKFLNNDESMRNMRNHRLWVAEKLGGAAVSIELGLTRDVLLQNPKNQSYWVNLQRIVGKFPREVSTYENLYIERILAENVKNDDVWFYALELILRLGTEVKRKALGFAKRFLDHPDAKNRSINAWQHCLSIVSSLGIDAIREELKFVKSIIISSTDGKNDVYAWSQRRLLCKELARHYSSKEELEIDDLNNIVIGTELELTREILLEDGRNKNAWQHRQWILENFGGWEQDFEFVNDLLEKDIYNDFAWNHRTFFVLRADHIREEDYDGMSYAVNAILENPDNECPWRYLKSFYDGTEYADSAIEDVCEFVLPDRDLEGDDDDDAILNKKICVSALRMVLDVIGSGYRPSNSMHRMINNLGSKKNNLCDGSISGFLDCICSILQYVDPVNVLYWKCRKTMLLDGL